MFTLLMQLNRKWRAVLMTALLVFLFPAFALAVAMSDVVELFKYSYGVDAMIYLGSVETVVYNLLKRRKKEVGGRGQWIIPYQKRNAGHMVGMAEGATLTSKRSQPDTAEATFSLIEFQAVWDITWKMLRQASKGKDAFETAMNFMDKSIMRRVFRIINAQVCSFTGLGELAILPAADDDTTITVNSLPFMDQGMYVDLIDATNNTTELVADRTIDAIDVQSRTVTISGAAAAGTAAGDYFVVSEQVTGGVSYSLHGLGAWLSNANPPATVGNIGNINRSTAGNEFYQGNVLANGGTLRAFTEDLLVDGENLIRERGGEQPSRYACNGNIAKRYAGDLIKDRYFAYNTVQPVDGGGKTVGFGREGVDLEASAESTGKTRYTLSAKPLHIEPYLRSNRLIGWNDNNFWIGHDGVEVPTPLNEIFDDMFPYFSMPSTPAAKFEVWHYWEAQVLSDNPQAGVQFQDLAES